ncbi:acetylglutamate kinase [Amphibacillus sediminis]|uniref:acetylglutamate kinase n=1 Tax=Amphibacillus sediminis TaxID=360185 RepID=UPI000830A6C2|nr:acetylglutamate kinase [Amphibacillus sediminis]
MSYIVIKCGGSIVDELPDQFFKSILQLQKNKQVKPVIVHGGGPMISSQLEQMNVSTTFIDGLRVTTNEVLDVVEMVLSGSVNKQIVRKLIEQNAQAVGMSGIDGHLIEAAPVEQANQVGYVGQVKKVNIELIQTIAEQNYIPVISPIAIGLDQQRYNINADTAAAAIAAELKAPLCFISDIQGICHGDSVLSMVNQTQITQLIEQEVIHGGMVPKVKAALTGLASGVPKAVIVNGHESNGLIKFIDGKAVGTRICLKEVSHV